MFFTFLNVIERTLLHIVHFCILKLLGKHHQRTIIFFFHLIVIKLDGNVVDPKKTFKILRLDATPKYYFIDRESIIFET